MATAWPQGEVPVIAVRVGRRRELGRRCAGCCDWPVRVRVQKGFRLRVEHLTGNRQTVLVVGADARGLLYGIGKLLREAVMERGTLDVRADLSVDSTPVVRLRGHQLGYRPKTNSYDAWDVALWEQYIRDLAVFGSNAIELIPPRSDDDADSPHFPLPPLRMMAEMSRLADEYGLDVWIWYPAMDKDYARSEDGRVRAEGVGATCSGSCRGSTRVFVPGGDPGHTQPKHLMALLEKQTANLQQATIRRRRCGCRRRASTQTWMDEFYALLKRRAGVAERRRPRAAGRAMPLPELRGRVPARYPIRDYPDITHSLQAQYPVPDWDLAFAADVGPRGDQPAAAGPGRHVRRPRAARIGLHHLLRGLQRRREQVRLERPRLGPEKPVLDILRRVQPVLHRPGATRRLRRRACWRWSATGSGPLATTRRRTRRSRSSRRWRRMARRRCANWRFQQALYRAYYDAYQRSRLLAETALEDRAMQLPRRPRHSARRMAVEQAERVLAEATTARRRTMARPAVALAEALFQTIRRS